MSAGRTMWFSVDVARHRRGLMVELQAEHGPVALAVDVVLCARAKEQNEGGQVREGFAAIARESGAPVDEVRAFIEAASAIGWLDEFEVDGDGRRFRLRVSGWDADQDAGRAAWRGDSGAAVSEAARWLEDRLGGGPVASAELQRLAEADGLAWRTVQRATRQVGARLAREGRFSVWSLPNTPTRAKSAPGWRGGASQQTRAITDDETVSRATARHAPLAQHSTGKQLEGERAGARDETEPPTDGPAAGLIPPNAPPATPECWPDLIEALSVVPEWRTALTLGGDVAVLQVVTGSSGVPWVRLAREAAASKLDIDPNSLRTKSPAHALQLRMRAWELRLATEGRTRRARGLETDAEIADRHRKQEAAVRRLSGGALFAQTDHDGEAA